MGFSAKVDGEFFVSRDPFDRISVGTTVGKIRIKHMVDQRSSSAEKGNDNLELIDQSKISESSIPSKAVN